MWHYKANSGYGRAKNKGKSGVVPASVEFWRFVQDSDLNHGLAADWLRRAKRQTRKPLDWKKSLVAYVRNKGLLHV